MPLLAESDLSVASEAAAPAIEPRLPWIGHAYPWPEECVVFWNKLFGPSRRHGHATSFIPRRRPFHAVTPQLRLAFLGDLLPARGKNYRVGEGLRRFLAEVDYLAINLEGVVTDARGVANAVRHDRSIIDFLVDFFPPERTLLLCANNHAADCGRAALERGVRELQARGFRLLGLWESPSLILPGGVQLVNGTEWLNVRRSYVPRLADADAAWSASATYRILCPHWGREMALYPTPPQIRRAQALLARWDAIIGHHPHCPQPIAEHEGRPIAYSLGNLARGDGGERGWHGAAVKLTLGPDRDGRWRLGEMSWTFTRQSPEGERTLRLDTAEQCRFFDV